MGSARDRGWSVVGEDKEVGGHQKGYQTGRKEES
jgi:hypothetical protein